MYSGGDNQSEIEEETRQALLQNTWDTFFQKYNYYEAIAKITSHYPESKTLYVSYNQIEEFDQAFAQELLSEPQEVLLAGESRIKQFSSVGNIKVPYWEKSFLRINLRIIELPDDLRIEIRNIRSPEVGKLISVTGIIRKNTEVLPRITNACFECSACSNRFYTPQGKGKLEEPLRCPSPKCGLERGKTRFKLITPESIFVDSQKIEIQENPETLGGGAQPLKMTVILEDDLSGKLFPGDREGFYWAAKLLSRLGSPGKGLAYLDRWLSTHPDDKDFLIYKGELLQKEGDPGASQRLFWRLYRQYPGDRVIWNDLVDSYRIIGVLDDEESFDSHIFSQGETQAPRVSGGLLSLYDMNDWSVKNQNFMIEYPGGASYIFDTKVGKRSLKP